MKIRHLRDFCLCLHSFSSRSLHRASHIPSRQGAHFRSFSENSRDEMVGEVDIIKSYYTHVTLERSSKWVVLAEFTETVNSREPAIHGIAFDFQLSSSQLTPVECRRPNKRVTVVRRERDLSTIVKFTSDFSRS